MAKNHSNHSSSESDTEFTSLSNPLAEFKEAQPPAPKPPHPLGTRYFMVGTYKADAGQTAPAHGDDITNHPLIEFFKTAGCARVVEPPDPDNTPATA